MLDLLFNECSLELERVYLPLVRFNTIHRHLPIDPCHVTDNKKACRVLLTLSVCHSFSKVHSPAILYKQVEHINTFDLWRERERPLLRRVWPDTPPLICRAESFDWRRNQVLLQECHLLEPMDMILPSQHIAKI